MLKAKEGNFFISDWLRNRNTVEFIGLWEQLHNPNFNYGGFATIKSQVGLSKHERFGLMQAMASRQLAAFSKRDVLKTLKKTAPDVFLLEEPQP